MSKIAIHLFGHMRTYKKCYSTMIEHLVAENDCDVFMHTWSETDRRTSSWYESNLTIKELSIEDQELILDLYKPKKFQLSEQNLSNAQLEDPFITPKMMHYSMRATSSLRTSTEYSMLNYDLVFMTRPDVMFKNTFPMSEFIKIADDQVFENVIFQGAYLFETGSYFKSDNYGGRDAFFFGKSEAMSKISLIGMDASIYKKNIHHLRTGETYFDNFLRANNLKGELISYRGISDWYICRDEV